jgi:hypothetical protein
LVSPMAQRIDDAENNKRTFEGDAAALAVVEAI